MANTPYPDAASFLDPKEISGSKPLGGGGAPFSLVGREENEELFGHTRDPAWLLKLECLNESPRDLIKMQMRILRVWGGAGEFAFLTSPQVLLALVVAGPQ